MNKKKNLLNLFTQDNSYNYHLIRNEDPNGYLLYFIKNGSKLDTDSLEFSPTMIIEELITNSSVIVEKFAPAIFFTDENDIDILKEKLNINFSESDEFSAFIETIKDEYRILEIKDSLLYKKDPELYNKLKEQEHIEKQKELWNKMLSDMEEKNKKREDYILSYNNNISELIKDYLESIIEYEKNDFNLNKEIKNIIDNLIDPETWIKIDEKPLVCNIEICSILNDKLDVFLTDNNEYLYTATLRLDKTILITENIVKISKNVNLPKTITDYNFLSKLYDIDLSLVDNWEFKNDSEKFEYVINYLVPIFKQKKEKEEKKFIDSAIKEENE